MGLSSISISNCSADNLVPKSAIKKLAESGLYTQNEQQAPKRLLAATAVPLKRLTAA